MSEIIKQIEEINNEFIEMIGGSYVKVNTGEMFTHTEVQKYISRKLEDINTRRLVESQNNAYKAWGIIPEQKLTKKKRKTKTVNNKSRYEGGDFNIVYRNKIEDVMNMKLELNEKLVYYVLRDFIAFPSNCVMINDQIPTFLELENIIGLKERTIRKVMKSLDDKGLIKIVQSGHRKAIYFNPAYYASGKDLYIETLEMFGLVECDFAKVESYMKD